MRNNDRKNGKAWKKKPKIQKKTGKTIKGYSHVRFVERAQRRGLIPSVMSK